jgi:hypothetical protein
MLLTQKADAIEDLARSGSRRFEALFQIRILPLQTVDSFGVHACPARRRLERLYASFGLKRTLPKRCKLVSEVAYELLKLFKSFKLRTFAV